MNFKLIICGIACLTALQNFAQEKSKIKFGKVTADDFKQNVYSLDSSANAIVIADIGSTEMIGNTKGGFSLEFKKFRRVHILNKNGYDLADVSIFLYTKDEDEEQLKSLKAVTFNLENGKIVETQLDAKTEVFTDKIDKNRVLKKFTFPNIKEGSIIDYEYKVQSDFAFYLRSWDFQSKNYPSLWSEYNVSVPSFYHYVILKQGYQPFYITDTKTRRDNLTIIEKANAETTDRVDVSTIITDFRWAMKDVPALKEENYTSTLDNHLARIQFQLAEYRRPMVEKNVMGTWVQACNDLLNHEDFGFSLRLENSWLNDIMSDATRGATGELDKARNIFAYVRDNMTCTNYNSLALEKPLKTVLKTKNGNEAEINLLLTAMLLKAGLLADPVILSTRSHGFTYPLYPMLNRFNYVITRFNLNGKYYFLDASKPGLGFGRLNYDAYNGHARIVNKEATPVELSADSLQESKIISVFAVNDEKGNLTGSIEQMPGYYESYGLRKKVKEKGKEQLFNDIKKAFNNEIEIRDPVIESMDEYDQPLIIRYKFDLKNDNENIIYFSPMFGEESKENPFKAAQRSYPVEMYYATDQMYLLRLDIPKGYIIDELPKSMLVKLNENNDGFFEYKLSESNGIISLRSRIKIKRTFFTPDEYEMLREFFNMVVKKHSEQIVFKKKS